LAAVIPFAVAVGLERTVAGLRLRAVGESPEAAASAGVAVRPVRAAAVIVGGLLAGLGGAALSTTTLDPFAPHMPAGLGFVALAAVVFGRWTPLGAASAALLFAGASALRIALANAAPAFLAWIPSGALIALPYVLTLLLLASRSRGIRAPAALGRPAAE